MINQAMREELAATGMPGMTLSLTTPDGFSAVLSAGYADLASRTPVRPDHRFYIGSISKSLVALSLFRLAQDGRFDLDGEVQPAMPTLQLPANGIRFHHLLNHTSGLPAFSPLFPRPSGGRLWSGFKPGSRFSYCNTGYNILGIALASAANASFPDALQRLALTPLGMTSARPAILTPDRASYAASYVPFAEDRPYFPGSALGQAPWVESSMGAGSIGATPADMARYTMFLGQLLTGRPSPLLFGDLAQRFLRPVVDAPEFGSGAQYGNGLAHAVLGGRDCLFHTGGTFSFSSSLTVDRESGVGCFASVNFGRTTYRPRRITQFAVEALRRFAQGQPTPLWSPTPDAGLPANAEALAGVYSSAERGRIEVIVSAGKFLVRFEGREGRLAQVGATEFWADHPSLANHYLAFEAGASGPPDLVWWGQFRFGRSAALPAAKAPVELAGLTGRYRNNDPWMDPVSIVARRDKLAMEGSGELVRADDGSWRYAAADLAMERVWFDGLLNGQATRLSISGNDFARIDG